jgi:hypothetical protein
MFEVIFSRMANRDGYALATVRRSRQMTGIHAHKHRVANSRQHIAGKDFTNHPRLAANLVFDPSLLKRKGLLDD